jgi:hypothetical protein
MRLFYPLNYPENLTESSSFDLLRSNFTLFVFEFEKVVFVHVSGAIFFLPGQLPINNPGNNPEYWLMVLKKQITKC